MNQLWYDKVAGSFNEALPLGNGYMGAMCFAGPVVDRFLLNADSLWYGGFRDRVNPDAKKELPRVRQFIREGRIREAETLANEALCGVPDSQCHYEPLGNLYFIPESETYLPMLGIKDGWNPALYDMSQASDYVRRLDIMTGIHTVCYQKNGSSFFRESFISYPDRIMAIHATGSKASLTFERGAYFGEFEKIDDRTLAFTGQAGADGVRYALVIRAAAGGLGIVGKTLHVDEDAVIYLASQTSFYEKDPLADAMKKIEHAQKSSYDQIKERHKQDVNRLMSRCELSLSGQVEDSCQELEKLTTQARLERVKNGAQDLGLVSLLFAYGRYLLIASSRPGSLPANLQGIWNADFLPMWDSKYTININAQMNYWPCEVTGLSELHEPLFSHMERMWPHGQQVAEKMYGARGWMAHHNTDIWGDCAPQDIHPPASYWQLGAAWLCLHLLEHYRFTREEAFLIKYADMIKEAILFFEDTLVKDTEGNLVVSPTVSPENTYRLENGETGTICEGASMDAQIIYELIHGFLEVDAQLEQKVISLDERKRYETILSLIPAPQIEENGTLQEWAKPYEEVEIGHRHISHLFALFPGNWFGKDEALREAAEKTLQRRLSNGGGHTGWSRAWIINLWARLGRGEEAYENILGLMRMSMLDNLFDKHPPFQIDGNFGFVSGIAEMLVQSQNEEIVFLPALPKAWSEGKVTGLVLRGAVVADITWSAGKLSGLKLYSSYEQTLLIKEIGRVHLNPDSEWVYR